MLLKLMLAISLMTVGLLCWLGLIVFLTAERRRWGVWLSSAAMFVGAIFFAFHAVLITYGFNAGMLIGQWPLAWVAGIMLPSAWYAMILWHIGFWENRRAVRHYRLHAAAFTGLAILYGAMCLLVFSDPMVRKHPLAVLNPYDPSIIFAGPQIGNIPAFALLYALLIFVCLLLALDALGHPAPSHRVMGDLARERARPWLVSTTLVLFLISVLVCGSLIWIMSHLEFLSDMPISPFFRRAIVLGEILVIALIALATVLIGQAVVSYEIFTGKSLPRRGLRSSWRNAVLLAGGLGALLAWLLPIDVGITIIVLVACLYALFTWRMFAEHENAVVNLRQFNAGPLLYHRLLQGERSADEGVAPFHALCDQVLGITTAYLWPLGPLSTLLPPLAYPAASPIPEGGSKLEVTPETLCLRLHPGQYAGALWAVPLWNDRESIGLFLLGPKNDGGLFTQEEMETARAVGERLMDTLAGAELARRLLHLQRERMAETQIADRRTRRVLHDDVLPRIHTTMLALNAGEMETAQAVSQLAALHREIADLLHLMPSGSQPTIAAKGVLGALRQFIEEELPGDFEAVTWDIGEDAEAQLRDLPSLNGEVLFGAAREAVRNAARHARGDDDRRPLRLRITAIADSELRLVIEDDGVGFHLPLPPTTGAGQGMTLHSTLMAIIGDAWETDSQPGRFTRVMLTLPLAATVSNGSQTGADISSVPSVVPVL
ncbi:MAG: sensor histidine kinase [Armatimonadota bacterium]